jgi:NADPH:quinone reductase-like Zn-dependent oxidoreductase
LRIVVLGSVGEQPTLGDEERDAPRPAEGQALVRIAAAGFCHHDALIMAGALRRGVRLPLVLGHEAAGVVAEIGADVAAEWLGARVVLLPGRYGHAEDGCFAESVAVPTGDLVRVPDGVALEHAALAACPIGVALKGVEDVGGLKAGETVVVTGVSGGLGAHAAQVAHATGARVLGVTSSPEKVARLEGMAWLDAVIVDGDVAFPDQVRALTDDGGAALVVDTVGGRLTDAGVRALGPGGRLVLLGQVSLEPAPLSGAEVLFRQAQIVGSLGAGRAQVERALELMASGDVGAVVDRELALTAASVREAFRLVRGSEVVGRLVLRP